MSDAKLVRVADLGKLQIILDQLRDVHIIIATKFSELVNNNNNNNNNMWFLIRNKPIWAQIDSFLKWVLPKPAAFDENRFSMFVAMYALTYSDAKDAYVELKSHTTAINSLAKSLHVLQKSDPKNWDVSVQILLSCIRKIQIVTATLCEHFDNSNNIMSRFACCSSQ